jgi:hypothetical protein
MMIMIMVSGVEGKTDEEIGFVKFNNACYACV